MTLPAVSRRSLLAGSAAVAAGLALPPVRGALAEAPKPLGGQSPAFYRFRVGEAEVTVVADGTFQAPPAAMLQGAPAAEIEAGLKAAHVPTDKVTLPIAPVVVNTGRNLVLIDAGCGPNFGPTGGRLQAQLALAGYQPGDFDTLIITHAHPDHIWGAVTDDGTTARFPNAVVYLDETENGFWTDAGLPSRVPEGMKGMVEGTARAIATLGSKVQLVQAGKEIVPGLSGIPTPGHTPGHTSIRLASGDAQLIVNGDVAHIAALQMAHPDWQFGFDSDPAQGVLTRKKQLDMLATDGLLVAAYHFPWPGVGYVVRDGGVYRWVPAQWELAL